MSRRLTRDITCVFMMILLAVQPLSVLAMEPVQEEQPSLETILYDEAEGMPLNELSVIQETPVNMYSNQEGAQDDKFIGQDISFEDYSDVQVVEIQGIETHTLSGIFNTKDSTDWFAVKPLMPGNFKFTMNPVDSNVKFQVIDSNGQAVALDTEDKAFLNAGETYYIYANYKQTANFVTTEYAIEVGLHYVNVNSEGDETNNSQKVEKALNIAQETGATLYFPRGTYDFNGLHRTEIESLSALFILGENEKESIILNPGTLHCNSDVSIRNISVKNMKSIFIWMSSDNERILDLDHVTYSRDDNAPNKLCFVYSALAKARIKNVNITNCNFSNLASAICIGSFVDGGYIAKNTITNLGSPEIIQAVQGLYFGGGGDVNGVSGSACSANNLIIEDNNFENFISPFVNDGAIRYCNGIMVLGNNNIIQRNTLKEMNGGKEHEGIYVKGKNIQILNNTLINAGDGSGAICVKNFTDTITVMGNIIKSNSNLVDATEGINLWGRNHTVKDNIINVGSGQAIYFNATDCDIINNEISNTSGNGILLADSSGLVKILNNKITVSNGRAVYGISPGTKLKIMDNEFNLTDAYAVYATVAQSSVNAGSIEASGNTIVATKTQAVHYSLFYLGYESSIISNNKISITSTRQTSSGGADFIRTNGKTEIINNTFTYEGSGTADWGAISIYAYDGNTIAGNTFNLKSGILTRLFYYTRGDNSSKCTSKFLNNIVIGKGSLNRFMEINENETTRKDIGNLIIDNNNAIVTGQEIIFLKQLAGPIGAGSIEFTNNIFKRKKSAPVIRTPQNEDNVTIINKNNMLSVLEDDLE